MRSKLAWLSKSTVLVGKILHSFSSLVYTKKSLEQTPPQQVQVAKSIARALHPYVPVSLDTPMPIGGARVKFTNAVDKRVAPRNHERNHESVEPQPRAERPSG